MMPPQPYPGMYYPPMTPEHFLSRRNVWALNAIGLAAIWVAFVMRLLSRDLSVLAGARFLVFTGGLLAVFVSTMAALGSKRTSDMQNVGLFIWSGFLLAFIASALGILSLM